MNKVISIGRLTDEPKVSETQNGKKIARFTLALDRIGEGTDFPSYIAWEKRAELIEKYCHKGHMIGIAGRIQTGSYDKDGRKIYTTDIVVDELQFLEKREKAMDGSEGQPDHNESDGFMKIPDGIDKEIPFG